MSGLVSWRALERILMHIFMKCVLRRTAVLLAFGLMAIAATICGAFALAHAATKELSAAARATVGQTIYQASATLAAVERVADARISGQRREIEGLQTQLKAAGAQLKAAGGRDAAAQARQQELQTQLLQAQERFVADLAQRDRAYAQEIAVFRSAGGSVHAGGTTLIGT